MGIGSDARTAVTGAVRGACTDLVDVARAAGEAVFYRRIILDPPPGWPKFRILLPIRKARR